MTEKIKRILLVDDDQILNFLHSRLFEKTGIVEQVDIALNGREALDYLAKGINKREAEQETDIQPEIILLDINMPVMDGWEFLEEYKKLGNTKRHGIMVVMLTSSLNPDDREKAKQYEEITTFINKPLSIPMIQEIFSKYLDLETSDNIQDK